MLERMFTALEKKEINADERTITAYGSRPVIDRDGELIKEDAWMLSSFKKNPVLMLAHDYRQPPIGKVIWIKQGKDGLRFKAQFAKSQIADEIFQLYQDDIMRAFSVGFIPKEWDEPEEKGVDSPSRVYTKVELLEISCVSIPSCQDALLDAYNSGRIKTKTLIDIIHKPETTENYHRVPVKGEEGKHDGHEIKTIDVSKEDKIKGLYCVKCKTIITYLFDKDEWSMEDAKEWVEEHSKVVEGVEEKQYECECIECGHTFKTDEHCRDVKCPECGGEMRRAERPGPGQASIEDIEVKEGRVLSTKNRKLVKQCADMLIELYNATETAPKEDEKGIDDEVEVIDDSEEKEKDIPLAKIDSLLESFSEKVKKDVRVDMDYSKMANDFLALLQGKIIEE